MSNMLVHTEDGDVSIASMNSFVAKVFDEDECFELIEEGVDFLAYCWPYNFVVSSTNLYVNWGHVSSFTSRS